jgi:RNase adapter protein RapZ
MSGPSHIVVITGLSGSGKSYVKGTLEDLGFYCVDNLPMALIDQFLGQVTAEDYERVGIVLDVRTRNFALEFPDVYRRMKERYANVVMIFLEAADEVLARRFSETRRPHPIGHLPILEAIRNERTELIEVRSEADVVLDTSQFSVHELKALIVRRFQVPEGRQKLLVTLISFGFKHGIPYNLDLLFDVRFLPNPHFVEALRPKTGLDPDVVGYLEAKGEYTEFLRRLEDFVSYLVPQYEKEMKSYLTIGIGCTGGRHRSVAIVEHLRAALADLDVGVEVVHRDSERGSEFAARRGSTMRVPPRNA